MLRSFTATFSPVDPADKVTEREFHQFDKDQNETVFRLDGTATSYDGTIDDAVAPGSCYLVDINSAGRSEPSPSVALVPVIPPPPPPTGVPKTPAITGVTFTS